MLFLPNRHLSYCTNAFTGDTLDALFKNITKYILPVKEKLTNAQPFAIGLWLSNQITEVLMDMAQLAKLKDWLSIHQLYVVTINGFPYGDFHEATIKTTVYTPDWTSAARMHYTKRLIYILENLLPDGAEGSISTLPLAYRYHVTENLGATVYQQCAIQLLKTADQLKEIFENTGKLIYLAIEPEPDCLLATMNDTIDFFEKYLLTNNKNRDAVETHLRICYDTCHAAVTYTDHVEIFKRLSQSKIRIGKVQISSALKIANPSQNPHFFPILKTLAESPYLHQVMAIQNNNKVRCYQDLIKVLPKYLDSNDLEWRIHYHVPIHQHEFMLMPTTQVDIIHVLCLVHCYGLKPHFEIETYTWELHKNDVSLDACIIKEYQWVLKIFSLIINQELMYEKISCD